jgi:polar amino acid transport system permease protein
MSYSFQFRDVFAAWEFLLDGLLLTLELSLVTMVAGLLIGMAGAAARVYGPRRSPAPSRSTSRRSATRR